MTRNVPDLIRPTLAIAFAAALSVWGVNAFAAATTTPAAASASSPAPATSTASNPAMPSPLALEIQKFKHETLNLKRRAQAQALAYGHPAYSRATLYLGVKLSDVVVQDVTLRIDGAPPVHHHYDRGTAIALIKHGLAPLGVFKIDPGVHTLKVDVRYTRGDVDDKTDKTGKQGKKKRPKVLEKTFSINKSQAAGQWVLHIDGTGFWGGTPAVELTQWVPQS